MPTTEAARPLRICQACGGLDDHPRHVIDGVPNNGAASKEFLAGLPAGMPATAIAELLTANVISRHIDCCAAAGCPVCIETEKVTKGHRGQKLIDTIASGALDEFEAPDLPREFTHG